jgi:hypothetical protein
LSVAAYAIFDFDDPVMLAGVQPLGLSLDRPPMGRLDGRRARPEDPGEALQAADRQVHAPPRSLGDQRLVVPVRLRCDTPQPGTGDRGGAPARRPRVGERKILVASLTYAILSSLVFTAIGYGIGQAVS